jgi:hypothetical protein
MSERIVYAIRSDQAIELTGGYFSATVPDGKGGRETINYTVLTNDPGYIKYSDKETVWSGRESDVRDYKRHGRPLLDGFGLHGRPSRDPC